MSDDLYVLDKLYISVNGVPFPSSKGIAIEGAVKEKQLEMDIPLSEGLNKIVVSVFNKNGVESLRKVTKHVHNYSDAQKPKRTLYLVTIGDAQYADDSKNLKYAAKDANDFAQMVKNEFVEYDSLITRTLVNKEVNSTAILKLKELLKNSKPDDYVIVFYAGHGLLNESFDYFLATFNTNFSAPEKGGMLYEELESILDGIPSRNKLLFLDACHSGEIDKEEIIQIQKKNVVVEDVQFRSANNGLIGYANPNYKTFELMNSVFNNLRQGNGAIVLSSAGGEQYALEGAKWNNGAFTFALLDGLKNKTADLNKDGDIHISELKQYLSKRVLELTEGKQKPNFRVENPDVNFVVH